MKEKYQIPQKAKVLGKWILLAAIALAAAFLIELVGYNYYSFVKGKKADIIYQVGDRPGEAFTKIREGKTTLYLMLDKAQYIKKIQIVADVPEQTHYQINLRYNTMFGRSEGTTVSDVYFPEIGTGYTKIDKDLKAIRIVFDSESPVEIERVRFFNETQVNPYRVFFFFIAVFLVFLFAFGRKLFEKRLEVTVGILILLCGSFIIYGQGVQENGWDEEIHFKTAYQLSYGEEYESNDTFELMVERIPMEATDTVEEKERYTQYLNDKFTADQEMKENTIRFNYKRVAYLNQAVAIWLGRQLGLSFNRMYMLGKFANLLTYAFLMGIAVFLMPRRKELVAALALVPTQVFIASGYTYDVLTHGLLMVGVVLWLKVILEEKNRYTTYYIIGSILALGIGSLAKAIYIPLLLLCCFIPKDKFASQRQFKIFWGVILAGAFVVAMTFIAPTVIHLFSSPEGWGGDSRGGDTDVVLQMKSILRQPHKYFVMWIKGVAETAGMYFLGTTGLANFGRYGEAGPAFMCLTVPWMLALMLLQPKGQKIWLEKRYKVGIGIASVLIIAFVWLAMYLSYTPVGSGSIKGVQARYYFPVVLPIVIVINSRMNVKRNKKAVILMQLVLVMFILITYSLDFISK